MENKINSIDNLNSLIKKFMKEYMLTKSELVNSNENYYKIITNVENIIQNRLPTDYIVKASCGQGRKSKCPWIFISNKNITKNATYGIYYAILFKSDMTGFYLSLCLGMESFKDKYKTNWKKNLLKVANYFRKNINSDIFKLEKIDLVTKSNTRGNGYELSNIIAKKYDIGNTFELEEDIASMQLVYKEIIENMSTMSFDEIISNILSYNDFDIISYNEAQKEIEKTLLELTGQEEQNITTLTEVPMPTNTGTKYFEMKIKKIYKKDYLNQTKKDIQIGLVGEKIVLEYEKKRLINLGRSDLADRVMWISKQDDSVGYDILSYDVIDNNVEEKYIEVKSTDSGDNSTFFISVNEVNVFEKYKEKYNIYRVFDLKTKNPKLFIINYTDFKNKLDLKIANYIASVI